GRDGRRPNRRPGFARADQRSRARRDGSVVGEEPAHRRRCLRGSLRGARLVDADGQDAPVPPCRQGRGWDRARWAPLSLSSAARTGRLRRRRIAAAGRSPVRRARRAAVRASCRIRSAVRRRHCRDRTTPAGDAEMNAWLLDTLLYTGVLIGLVLALRRPVGRFFGPQLAYALWALPFLRLLLPPIVLPASLAPAPEPASQALPAAVLPTADPANIAVLAETSAMATPVAAPSVPSWEWADLVAIGVSLWAGVALAFLVWRVVTYRQMRRALLEGADRKSTRLNSSHVKNSYAVFCLKK